MALPIPRVHHINWWIGIRLQFHYIFPVLWLILYLMSSLEGSDTHKDCVYFLQGYYPAVFIIILLVVPHLLFCNWSAFLWAIWCIALTFVHIWWKWMQSLNFRLSLGNINWKVGLHPTHKKIQTETCGRIPSAVIARNQHPNSTLPIWFSFRRECPHHTIQVNWTFCIGHWSEDGMD